MLNDFVVLHLIYVVDKTWYLSMLHTNIMKILVFQ